MYLRFTVDTCCFVSRSCLNKHQVKARLAKSEALGLWAEVHWWWKSLEGGIHHACQVNKMKTKGVDAE